MENSRAAKESLTPLEELLRLAEEYTGLVRELSEKKSEKKAEDSRPGKELVLRTAIAGIEHRLDPESEEGKAILASLGPGTELVLRREPENRWDPWAVAVETLDGRALGYLTRYKNETVARMMDHGHRFEAWVEEPGEEEGNAAGETGAPTEDYILPFSVWMTE